MKTRTLALLLAISPLVLLGAECGDSTSSGGGTSGGGSAPGETTTEAYTYLDPWSPAGSVGEPFTVDVILDADLALLPQAYDLKISVDASRMQINSVVAHGDFDDDGSFLIEEALLEGGSDVRRLIDVRHGSQPQWGLARILTVEFQVLTDGDPIPIEITGEAAGEDGGLYSLINSQQNVRVR